MGVHTTRDPHTTLEVVTVHPATEAGHVRLEAFYAGDFEASRLLDITLTPAQADALAAGLTRAADRAERTWAEALTDTDRTDSMTDFDDTRRQMVESGQPQRDLAADDGPTWDTAALQRDFRVISFAAPFVVVERKTDGVRGTLEFTHSPRLYFAWRPES